MDASELAQELIDTFVQTIPDGAVTMRDLMTEIKSANPSMSAWRIKHLVAEKIESGEWLRERIRNTYYYWKKLE